MPFTRVIRPITEGFQHLRQEPGPRRPRALGTTLYPWQGIATNLLSVVPSEDGRPRRPASGRVIELREAQAVLRKGIEIRSRDLAAVACGIGESHVVRDHHKNVGLGRLCSIGGM